VTAHQIGMMKPTACIVNTARGHLIDEAALVAALRDGRIRGAALDVFHTEPLPVNHPLRTLDNVVLSPHMGYVSAEAYDQFFRAAVDNVEAYLDARVPAGAMNPEVLQDGKLRKKTAAN
jgi:phosphoglycerate dehydrogenase-like enzyme